MRKFFITILFLVFSSFLFAQAPPPIPIEPPGGGSNSPIGDGLLFLLLAGIFYGVNNLSYYKRLIFKK